MVMLQCWCEGLTCIFCNVKELMWLCCNKGWLGYVAMLIWLSLKGWCGHAAILTWVILQFWGGYVKGLHSGEIISLSLGLWLGIEFDNLVLHIFLTPLLWNINPSQNTILNVTFVEIKLGLKNIKTRLRFVLYAIVTFGAVQSAIFL